MMKTSRLARGGLIAAIYAVLTLALPFIGFGPIQFRFGEALCVLPYLMPEAVWGLTGGCLIANFVGMTMGVTTVWDVVFGTLATLLASITASRLKREWLVPLPAVIFNAVIVGTMLTYVMIPGMESAPLYWNIITVGLGQIGSCYVLGLPLLKLLKRTNIVRLSEHRGQDGVDHK